MGIDRLKNVFQQIIVWQNKQAKNVVLNSMNPREHDKYCQQIKFNGIRTNKKHHLINFTRIFGFDMEFPFRNCFFAWIVERLCHLYQNQPAISVLSLRSIAIVCNICNRNTQSTELKSKIPITKLQPSIEFITNIIQKIH